MGERGWEYRRRRPEGTVLYAAVRDHLATLLAEASELGRGLPRYAERDFANFLECGVCWPVKKISASFSTSLAHSLEDLSVS